MSTHLTVRQFGLVGADHRVAFSSLPAALRLIETGTPDIALVGSDTQAIEAALALEPKAIVLAAPASLADADLQRLLGSKIPAVPVLTLAASIKEINAESVPAQAGLVHSRLNWPGDLKTNLIEHLAALSTLLGYLDAVRLLSRSGQSYIGSAVTKDGTDVTWSGRLDDATPNYELDIVGLAERLEVRGNFDGSARPLLVRRAHAGGLDQPLGTFETGLRLFWRHLAEDLVASKPLPDLETLRVLRDLIAGLT